MSRWEVRISDPRRERRVRLLLVLALLALPLAFYGGQRWQAGDSGRQADERERLARKTETQARELETLRQRYVVMESGEQLARQAVEQNRQTIKGLEEQIFKLQQDLAFYQGVLAPDSRREGLRIGTFELHAGDTPRRFRYKLTLSRVGQDEKPLSGRLRVSLIGKQAGKDLSLDLAPLTQGLPDALSGSDIPFDFKHFQAIPEAGRYGEIDLPEGFEPRQIKVRATIQGQAKEQERLFNWIDGE
ncbi:DUF6776 family protein [Pseudomonas sp. RIT-PI-AD]|uniref:DUF6776 family protein n=1 Tax=Pseudomonas sp. RIT-PI-AD TaxID=3035294 RepID=UPI0021DA8665|nr:DUF6776 family protein [Pseudomonas sp. RIT-PI-AD]